MAFQGFQPEGNTVAIAASATSPPLGVQVPPFTNTMSVTTFVISFAAATQGQEAFVGYGATAAEAQANAVQPTVGTSQKVIVLTGFDMSSFRFPQSTYFSAVTSSGNAVIYITPGDGRP